MRDKLRAARPVKAGRFDVKHSAGGMMDVEFAVQYLVLAHSAAHPELLDNVGNIALLQRAEACGLLPDRRRHARRRRLPRAAPRAAPCAAGRAADAGRPEHAGRRSATPCSRCGARCSADARAGAAARLGRAWPLLLAAAPRSAALARLAVPLRARLAARRWRRASRGAPAPRPAVHYSPLHLGANLAGAALVGALGVVRARAGAASRWPGWRPGR